MLLLSTPLVPFTFIKTKSKFCFECEKFPCLRIKQLDKRYRTKYNMSVLENLENIKKLGVREFVQNEKISMSIYTICEYRVNFM